jgi:hypothetical protein
MFPLGSPAVGSVIQLGGVGNVLDAARLGGAQGFQRSELGGSKALRGPEQHIVTWIRWNDHRPDSADSLLVWICVRAISRALDLGLDWSGRQMHFVRWQKIFHVRTYNMPPPIAGP